MVEQPAEGYRISIDTVFLAAAVPAESEDNILDFGCGVGGAMLCVSFRVPKLKGLGLEAQPELVNFCNKNILRNAFASGLEVRQSDVTKLSDDLKQRFDHALMNPPYHESASHSCSANQSKRKANTESAGHLSLWISSASAALRSGGSLTLIHKAERLKDILSCLNKDFGNIKILSFLPKEGGKSKRFILRAYKGASYSVEESKPFILHDEKGRFTKEAEDVLREGTELHF